MMKRYIREVGRDRGIKEVNTMEEISGRRFFNLDIDSTYEMHQMSGAAHCEVFEAFRAVKNLKVGITYNEKVNLVVFAGEDIPLPTGQNRKIIFQEGVNKVNEMSKRLSEFIRFKYLQLLERNKYRGVVHQALIKPPLSSLMMANRKAFFNDFIFRYVVKARNQALMTPFMLRVLFRIGDGILEYATGKDKTLYIIC
jgi:hypothetical protein